MSSFRIALANVRIPRTPEEGITITEKSIHEAGSKACKVICFPECFIPGYRALGRSVPRHDPVFMARSWQRVSEAAAKARIAVILGTERMVDNGLRITTLVINPDGSHHGFQDKVQLDPSEDDIYTPGIDRSVFRTGDLTFGISICHEGWRYPETVRFAARQGAQLIFHPHFHEPESNAFRPATYGDPRNSFHENAVRCRAAENTCYFATVNCAIPGSPSTSAVANPDGSMLCYQPYGVEGLLIADLDLSLATGYLAARYKAVASA